MLWVRHQKSVGGYVALGMGYVIACMLLLPQTAFGSCSNESVRTGASVELPDCRAYELVTPADAAGQIFSGVQFPANSDMFPTEPASSLRDSLIFGTEASNFITPPGGGGRLSYDIWQAERTSAGWQTTRHVTPTPAESLKPFSGGISADHKYIFTYVGPWVANKLPGEFGSLFIDRGADYLGDSSGHFELTGCGSLGCEQYAQGRYISPGGGHVLFTTGKDTDGSEWCSIMGALCKSKKLEPDAAPTGTGSIYDRPAGRGPAQVISLLPGEVSATEGQDAVYQGVSADGGTVAFTIDQTLYVRVKNEKTEAVTPGPATYGGFAGAGRYLFYVEGEDIHRFDTVDESDEAITASGDASLMNVSEDGSHVYFLSPSQLDGLEGVAGDPNMYLWSDGSTEFIATVAESDVEGFPALGTWTRAVAASPLGIPRGPGVEASRVTPDGKVIVFESTEQLDDDRDNGGHTAIYRRVEGQPVECVSCNPSGAPSAMAARFETGTSTELTLNNLSVDGNRVFFETSEPLVDGDVDGINDSYEWHLTPGIGVGPELGLISSGQSLTYPAQEESDEQNTLFGITRSGSDVFFKSQDALVSGAGVGGTPAIYDARIGGGFPQPDLPLICVEEGCRPPVTPAPVLGTASSASLQGSGNVAPKKKHRRHHRCTRKQKARHCSKKRGAGASRSSAVAHRLETDAATFRAPAPEKLVGPSATLSGSTSAVPAGEGEWQDFKIESVESEASTTAAAQHPDVVFTVEMKKPINVFSAHTQSVAVKLPPGFYGNPTLTLRCTTGQLLSESCPIDSQVGVATIKWGEGESTFSEGGFLAPLYNIAPAHPDREIARFGFGVIQGLAVFIDTSVRTATDYGITVTARGLPGVYPLVSAKTVVWGNPADSSHNKLRMTQNEAQECEGTGACKAPGGERSPEHLGPIAFTTNPSACGPWSVFFELTSYALPGQSFGAEAPVNPGPVDECHGLPFAPSLEARPTTDVAGAPTGLNSSIRLPQSTDPSVPSTATMREARVTLPEGMTINPSAADGLAACSDEQVHFHEEVDAECPDASKIGSLKIISPALVEPLEGAVYQRSPEPGHLFRLWLVTDELGLHVKIPGEVRPDPNTGQLTAVFSDLPQVPVEEIELEVWGGARAPLKNPDTCGEYETTSSLAPWSSDPAATPSDRFLIDRAPDGGPCKEPSNSPGFEAGTASPIAGAYSPLLLHLHREDGSQNFGAFEVTLPPGLTGKLAGIAECSESALAAAAHKSGREEESSPSCPLDSRIGTANTATGAGPAPFWTQGKVYLAGPYKGAPLSAATIAPAVAGPFDLGTVVVRAALYIDPETAKVTVKTDPLPTILEGVPLNLRTVAVQMDRDQFTLNGTSCEPLSFSGRLTSTLGNVAPLSQRFQLGECGRLGFKPKLAFSLKGGTKRADYPALTTTLKARNGDADLSGLTLALPHSEFIAQEHLVTICTRVQFAANNCPKGSVYGHIKAWTPLLSKPLEGPVYLRSSSNPLPDLVLDLRGQIEVVAVGRIDSHNGGVRVKFKALPDAPLTKAVVKMKGGAKGIFVNSTDICGGRHQATVNLQAHNGRRSNLRPALVSTSCAKHHRHPRKHR